MLPRPNRKLRLLNIVTMSLMLIAAALVFFYAPRERVMGEVQRIFYFHVSAAWVGFLAFFVTLCAGVAYLATGRGVWDTIAASSVEVGLVFTVMAIISGSIWARPAWNTWWTWDPRLTTYSILALIYVAYLMLRQGLEDPGRRGRFAAVYGIVGFISVPITFFSIRWWRTIHPVVVGTGTSAAQGGFDMTAPMRLVFFFSLFAFTVLYFCFLANRVQLQREMDHVEQLKAQWAAE
jgi:heme exporter protein C